MTMHFRIALGESLGSFDVTNLTYSFGYLLRRKSLQSNFGDKISRETKG